MKGYLLDTCIVSYWANSQAPEHQPVAGRIDGLPPDSPLAISVVTLGEIEYGHCAHQEDSSAREKFRHFVRDQLPWVLEVRKTTAPYYGDLRARLFGKYGPKSHTKALRVEQLTNPIAGNRLGIQENDLWIAAQAVEHNLVLVTHDSMRHIRGVAEGVLTVEDWAAETHPRAPA